MKIDKLTVVIASLLLVSATLSLAIARSSALIWHGGKALVLIRTATTGWVGTDYQTHPNLGNFRAEFADQGWTADYATNVTAALLQNYDALFVLTPCYNIPDGEAEAIRDWVIDGGQLMITQNEDMTFADEITQPFGITWISWTPPSYGWDADTFDYTDSLTTTPNNLNLINGFTANQLIVAPPAKAVGWHNSTKDIITLAVAEEGAVGDGIVIALCDEAIWGDFFFVMNDNEELMENVLARFRAHSSVPGVPEFEVSATLISSVTVACYLLSKKFSIAKPGM